MADAMHRRGDGMSSADVMVERQSRGMEDWMSDAPMPPQPQFPQYPPGQFPIFGGGPFPGGFAHPPRPDFAMHRPPPTPMAPMAMAPTPQPLHHPAAEMMRMDMGIGPGPDQPSTSAIQPVPEVNIPTPLNYVVSSNKHDNVVHVMPEGTIPRGPRELVMGPDIETDENVWCSVILYEEEERAGKTFAATVPKFTVDGYCANIREDRFSIGSSNVAAVPGSASSIRSQIGKGIVIERQENGKVFLHNEGDAAVFIQTPLYATMNRDPPNTVYRVSGCNEQNNSMGRNLQIYDCDYFNASLKTAMEKSRMLVHHLIAMCTVRVSFVKGFGSNYRRQQITSCPCWIEIKFDQYLKRLDQILESMQPDDFQMNSHSL